MTAQRNSKVLSVPEAAAMLGITRQAASWRLKEFGHLEGVRPIDPNARYPKLPRRLFEDVVDGRNQRNEAQLPWDATVR